MYQVSNEEYLKDLEKYHKWDELMVIADRIISRNDDSSDLALYYKGIALHETRNLDLALQSFNDAIQRNPNNPLFYNGKGLLLRDLGKNEEAISNFDLAFKKDPYMTNANINKAQTLQQLNRKEEALTIYDAILKKNANLVTVLIFKAECLKELKRTREALAVYDRAIEIEPNAPDLQNNKGNILAQENRINEALDCYNKALYLNPEFADTYFNIGLLYHDQGKYKEAISYYNQAIDYEFEGPFANINRGLCYLELQVANQAEKDFEKAISNWPSNTFSIYNRGIFAAYQGKVHEAIILFKKAIKTIDVTTLVDPKIEQVVLDLEAQYNKSSNLILAKNLETELKVDYHRLAGDFGIRRNDNTSIDKNLKEFKLRIGIIEEEIERWSRILDQFHQLKTLKPEVHEYLTAFVTLYNEFLVQLPPNEIPRKAKSLITKTFKFSREDILRLFYIAGGESAADFVNKSISDPPTTKYTRLLNSVTSLVNKKKPVVDIEAIQTSLLEGIITQLVKTDIKNQQIKEFDLKAHSLHSFIIKNAIKTHPQIQKEIDTSAKAIAVKDFILINAYLEDNKNTLLTNEESFEVMFDRIYRENAFESQKMAPLVSPIENLYVPPTSKEMYQIKILLDNKQKAKSGHQLFIVASLCRDVPPNQISSPALKWQQIYKSPLFFLTETVQYQFGISDQTLPFEYSNTAAIKIEVIKQKGEGSFLPKGQSIYYLNDLLSLGSKRFTFIQQNTFSKKTITVSVEASGNFPINTVASRFF